MKLLPVFAAVFLVTNGQDTCPAYADWMPQTDTCLWFPLTEMRQSMLDACEIDFDASRFPTPPPFPQEILDQLPDRCGYCSFKFQCRKRDPAPQCFPIEGKHETCSEFPQPCVMPKAPMLNNCNWGIFMEMLKQCINRPDVPDWKRKVFQKWGKMAPEANCIEKDGGCTCCCHPYKPNRDGSECVRMREPECQDWSDVDWNEWSDCLWGMPQQIVADFRSHCNIGVKAGAEVTGDVKLPLPEGFEMPDACGYCSFKVRCKKRDRKDSSGKPRCFPVAADKKACGPEDCPTCGDVCTLPKIRNSCNYGEHIRKFLKTKMSKIEKMPYWRKRGFKNIAKNLPHGKCVEVDGQCKCCCHPYEPTSDGTACQLKEFCKLPGDLGLDIFGE